MTRWVVVAFFLVGSSHHAAARYAVSADNVSRLRTFRRQNTVAVGGA
jgi:hypothetical protein